MAVNLNVRLNRLLFTRANELYIIGYSNAALYEWKIANNLIDSAEQVKFGNIAGWAHQNN